MAPIITIDANNLKVAGVVAFYMFSALVMVFVNKAVLNSTPDLPLLFLLFQLLIAVVLLHVSAFFTKKIQIPVMDLQVAKSLVPVVSVNIIGLVFNTLCLRDVEASFFQIARGLVLPLTIVVSCAHTRSTPTQKVILAAGIVTLGFMLGVAPSKGLPDYAIPSTLSLIYGVMSSVFIAVHAVLIKGSLPHCNNSTIELAWWTNAGSAIMILPFVFFRGEPWKLLELYTDGVWQPHVFAWGSLVTGVFGFLLCISGLLSIKVTSPITHMFSSAARSVLQTLIGVWAFGDIITVNRGLSLVIILGGTMFYTWVKSRENAAAAAAPARRNADVEHGSTQEERAALKLNEFNEKR